MLRPATMLIAASALSGCSAVAALNRASAPVEVFEIRAARSAPVAIAGQGTHLTVELPAASGSIDAEAILVRPTPTQVAYLPGARWSAEVPEMLQVAMIETLLATGAFRFVGRQPLGLSGDVALVSELTEFAAIPSPGGEGGGAVQVTLVAHLVREADAEVIATRRISHRAAIPDASTGSVVAGFESATEAVLADLARWVLTAQGIAHEEPAPAG